MSTLRDLRSRRYLTQTELANIVGVSLTTIAAWEGAKKAPRLRNIPKLAEALGVEPLEVERAISETWSQSEEKELIAA